MDQAGLVRRNWKSVVVPVAAVSALVAVACSNSPPAPPRAAVAAFIVGSAPMSPAQTCGLNTQPVLAAGECDGGPCSCDSDNGYLPCLGDPNTGFSFDNGAGGNVNVQCTVKSFGASFEVDGFVQVPHGNDSGSITINGKFKPFDPTATGPQQADADPSIPTRVVFNRSDAGGVFTETDCTTWYTLSRNMTNPPSDNTSHPPSKSMGVAPGRFWATIFCPKATFSDPNSQHKFCAAVATIKLENCDQGQN